MLPLLQELVPMENHESSRVVSTGFFFLVNQRTNWAYTLWLFNIAMENSSFIDDFPIKTFIYKGFSMAMLNNQMVIEKNDNWLVIPSGND